jgi:hypothetical protein
MPLVLGSASRRSNQGRELNQVRPGNSVRGMGNECCHGKTVGWHWNVLGDAGFGYFELLKSLWVVLATNTSINTGKPVPPRVWGPGEGSVRRHSKTLKTRGGASKTLRSQPEPGNEIRDYCQQESRITKRILAAHS